MQYNQGARVVLAGGDEIGQLSRLVIDPRNMQISDLIVRRGSFAPEEKVVPVTLVDTSTEEEVHLLPFEGGWSDLRDFRETSYRIVDEADLLQTGNLSEYSSPLMFAYPPAIPTTGALPPGMVRSEKPMVGLGAETGIRKEVHENIPQGSITIQSGTDVYSIDHEKLGAIERIFTAEETDQVSHIVISKGLLFKERKLIPVNWVDQVDESSVRLGVSARFVGRLPAFEEG